MFHMCDICGRRLGARSSRGVLLRRLALVVRIAINPAAFEAIARTPPFGTVSFENKIDENGDRLIWLPPNVVDRLSDLRGPGESYSDVIMRVAADG